MLDTTDLPVQYTVGCAELAELPAGLTLNERPPENDAENIWAEDHWALFCDFWGGE